MTSTVARLRYILFIVIPIAAVACRSAANPVPVPVLDLLREFAHAEKRPSGDFEITTQEVGGITWPSIVVPVPSRLTWGFPLPRRGVFRAFLAIDSDDPAAAVRFRFGVSDHRIYEGLAEHLLTAGPNAWIDFHTDLSAYAGFKWSLFYRPDRISWRVVLAADAVGTGSARAIWGSPEIVTDPRSAREYASRRQALR